MTRINTALFERDQLEDRLDLDLWFAVEKFLAEVVNAAAETDFIVAAAVRDEFAWTNINARWGATIRELSKKIDYIDVETFLNETDLPQIAFEAALEVAQQARSEGWSTYKTRNRLRRALLPHQQEGESKNDFRNRVRAIARTEATRSYGSQKLKTLASGGFKEKMWVSKHDERTRDSHSAADGQVVRVTDYFSVGGENLMYPADPAGSAENTRNCRCVMVEAGTPENSPPPYNDINEEGAVVAAGTKHIR